MIHDIAEFRIQESEVRSQNSGVRIRKGTLPSYQFEWRASLSLKSGVFGRSRDVHLYIPKSYGNQNSGRIDLVKSRIVWLSDRATWIWASSASTGKISDV
ncbi:hypothetical protein NSTC745_00113 [Nostoc sp. DSM 114161]|jgi:hypothetical protein